MSLTVNTQVIPPNFLGVQTLQYPTLGAFNATMSRTWDYAYPGGTYGIQTRTVNPSSGTFYWTQFDAFFTNLANLSQLWVTIGTPADWMITRAALGGALFGTKGNMCPTGATELTNNYIPAVQAMVNRAKNTFGRTGLIWEMWNEFDLTPGELVLSERPAMAAMAKAVYQAIKAIDPTAIVIAPCIAYSGSISILSTFLQSSDGATGRGGDWCDGVSFHFYNQHELDNGFAYAAAMNLMRQGMISAGYSSLPIYLGESGFYDASEESYALPRRMLAFAAFGVKCVMMYARDFVPNPMEPFVTQFNEISALLTAGSTVSNLQAWPDGTVSATVNGTVVRY